MQQAHLASMLVRVLVVRVLVVICAAVRKINANTIIVMKSGLLELLGLLGRRRLLELSLVRSVLLNLSLFCALRRA